MAIQFKRGTSAQWATNNTVLLLGQPGLDTTLKRWKIGDGGTPWAGLDWSDKAIYDALAVKRTYLGIVASQTAMLALPAAPGDWCQRSDLANQVFELAIAPAGTVANWKGFPLGSVTLIDNLTTGGTGSALSAEQGKTLNLLKAPLASPTFTGTVSGISRAMVGLGNVDNTADANKPVSTPQQTAIDAVRTNLGSVSSQAAMLALSGAKRRDFVTRSDLGGQVFELVGTPPSTLSNWFGFPLPASFPQTQQALVPASGTVTIFLDAYRSVLSPYTVSGPLTFVFNNTGAIEGASINFTLIGNGTDTPAFSGFTLIGGTPVGNVLGQSYEVSVFLGQGVAKYGVVLGAVLDTTAPQVSARSVADGSRTTLNLTFNEAVRTDIVPAASAFVLSGHTSTAYAPVDATHGTLTFTPAMTPGEVATLSYTQPGTNGLRDSSNNLMANFTGQAVTNNIAAGVPSTMSAPVATAGTGQISYAFTAPASNGATIIDYTVTLSTGETFTGGASPIVATGLTAVSRTGTIKARNSVGSSIASPASNSVTPVAQTGFTDDFNRTASTTSMGNGWVNQTGTWGIDANGRAYYTNDVSTNGAVATHDLGGTLKPVYVDLVIDSNIGGFNNGVMSRFINATNYIQVLVSQTKIQVFSSDSGYGSFLATYNGLAYTANTTYRLGVVPSVTGLTIYMNGVALGPEIATTLHSQATQGGLLAQSAGASTHFDNFSTVS